uniref:CARD domain-containing protein n=1 Tax=Strigamia maritima TaxID=126957 RepID=T1JAA0_STRMM
MNHKEKLALIKQRERVINDLDPKYTLDYLLSKGILDVRSDQLVRAQSTPSLRAAKLLDILPNCNGNAFKIFIDSLNNKKNYPWLANSLNDELNRQDSVSENKNVPIGMLLRGGVPRLGDYHINRPKEVDEVKKKLKNQFLQRGWVILHGMMGCGKSTVAAAAISDDQELISEYFTSGVFWVSCRAIDEGSLLTKMKALCEKLDKSYRNVSFDNIVVATERLRELFSRPEYFDVLLILDDVWTKLVVDSFNVGCNTLVTTTDSDLFGNVALKQEVNISSGFTEAQSLELLSKHAGVKVGDLPATAKNIHNISKGVPVLISAVGGYISNFPHDPAKWAICVKKLTGKTDGTRESNLRETIHGMLDLNLSVLKDELISYYYTLAVFREDVYVPREVLITFWDRNNIDEIMITFVKKSLVIRSWDDEGRTYLYIVHNLLLEYLKQKNTSNIAKFHKQLIERYQEKCDGKWHLLGDDSYIFESIGYHLHMAGLKDIMKEIYFDFKFIKAKIDNTMGCANLLYDYQKYFKDLTEPDFTKKLRDFIHFIRVNSDLLSDKNFDCLQLALCQPETSEVYKQARQMIPSCNQNAFYFDWCNKDNNKGACVSSCNIHKAAVRSAIFTPTGCRVISCDDDGMIRIWDSNSVKELCEIQGHNSRIRCCSFCVELKILVTCSADKTIKLWSVPANFFEEQNGNSDDSKTILSFKYF